MPFWNILLPISTHPRTCLCPSGHFPLLRTIPVVIYSSRSSPALADNFSMFSSAPFLQDVAVSGYLDQWRKLFAISVAFPAHRAHHSHPGANPDFYACVKEVGVSWNLHFVINTWRTIRSSTLSDAQLLPVLTNNDIRTMTLNGEILSVLDRYSLLNWKELFLYSPFFICVVLRVQCTSIFLLQTNISFDVQRYLETSVNVFDETHHHRYFGDSSVCTCCSRADVRGR
ncbi:hypothetical protein EV421DRAFT_1839889 [Armillaria borealis]|uniref:Uncharacterized protein n=1 Tax=Armillaria borealis TaxID=47425 RepID=A0AA39MI06_9AGAR|nr:hypothetical protein EV421DRAFT_1839889 [Armillaria borealis]